MRFFLLLFASLLNASSANAVKQNSTTLHVTSFNIKGLPSYAISGDYDDSRYSLIGKLLAGSPKNTQPNVVLLQEAFHAQSEALIAASGFPFRARGPEAKSFLSVSSGLHILSTYPIVEQHTLAFGSKNCMSWDCFANKGVQFARIAVPGMPRLLEVFNTHLQAGREDTSVRQTQVKMLIEFFKKHHKPDCPVIFGGDFNFRPALRQKSYVEFARDSSLTSAGKYCLDSGCTKVTDSGWHGVWARAVDHQFYSTKGPVKILPTRLERNYREKVENLKLSDHPSLEVHYRLQWVDSDVPMEAKL